MLSVVVAVGRECGANKETSLYFENNFTLALCYYFKKCLFLKCKAFSGMPVLLKRTKVRIPIGLHEKRSGAICLEIRDGVETSVGTRTDSLCSLFWNIIVCLHTFAVAVLNFHLFI